MSGTLLAHEPRAAAARVRLGWARPSMSLHVLYLGADRTWPDTPLAHHNILYAGDPERALRAVFGPPWGGTPRRRPTAEDLFLYVHVPTRTDPTIAPDGCESLYVLVAAPRCPGGEGRRGSRPGSASACSRCSASATCLASPTTWWSSTRSVPSTSGTS